MVTGARCQETFKGGRGGGIAAEQVAGRGGGGGGGGIGRRTGGRPGTRRCGWQGSMATRVRHNSSANSSWWCEPGGEQ